ncbi:hypothetical protein [Microbacterium sp.]|uniref:hypothetical protein n=1 Tax=Microbacterium sp. TaxID=51671 RepID=UPI0039E26D87
MHPELRAQFEALANDAGIWDEAGDVLSTASGDIGAISIHRGAFSFAGQDVADRYQELHTVVVDLLRNGAANVRAGADTLIAIRDDFMRLEDITHSEYYAMWQPVV